MPEIKVGMADAARGDTDQYFGALGLRIIGLDHLQGLVDFDQMIAFH